MTKIHTESYSAGGVVVNSQGKVCLVSNKLGKWSLPKGKLEAGEETLVAAKREIFEESGISQLTLVCKLGTYSRFRVNKDGTDDKKKLKHIALFLFKTPQLELNSQDADNPQAVWVDMDSVANQLSHPVDQDFFLEQLPLIQKSLRKFKD